jgi:hypothetical protein
MNLTPAQAAFLATILPNPKAFHEQYEKGQLSPSMKNRLAVLLKHMRARDRIDDEALAFGLEELQTFAFYAPDRPPPVAPILRGTAQPLPFRTGGLVDPWEALLQPEEATEEDDGFVEDGSFGPSE